MHATSPHTTLDHALHTPHPHIHPFCVSMKIRMTLAGVEERTKPHTNLALPGRLRARLAPRTSSYNDAVDSEESEAEGMLMQMSTITRAAVLRTAFGKRARALRADAGANSRRSNDSINTMSASDSDIRSDDRANHADTRADSWVRRVRSSTEQRLPPRSGSYNDAHAVKTDVADDTGVGGEEVTAT
jgi:hypothetical protein